MKFEWNDLRAFITVINVLLIMKFGLSIAWFSLGVASLGLGKRRDYAYCKHSFEYLFPDFSTLMY